MMLLMESLRLMFVIVMLSDAALIQVLSAANADWIVASSSSLWTDVSSLLIQIRKLFKRVSVAMLMALRSFSAERHYSMV